jgi:hypothetical protein
MHNEIDRKKMQTLLLSRIYTLLKKRSGIKKRMITIIKKEAQAVVSKK